MTAQALDDLAYEGKECLMQTELALIQHPRISTLSDREAREQCSVCFSTACWRNFLGEWEVRDGRLFLNRLRGKYNLLGSEPLAAHWVSGTIHVQEAEIISDFWDDKYNGGNPRTFVIKVQEGIVVRSEGET